MRPFQLLCVFVSAVIMLGASLQPDINRTIRPDEPRRYLDLGEQLVALAETSEDLDMARHVLAMGVSINVNNADAKTASSCCIALASAYPNDPQMQQMLWDLALHLDSTRFSQWVQHRPGPAEAEAKHDAAECLRRARHEDDDVENDLYRQPQIQAAIFHAGTTLGFTRNQIENALNPLLSDSIRDPCNGNYFDTQVENGESVRRVCVAHQFPMGTTRDNQTLLMLLGIEAECLKASEGIEDWGSAYTLGNTAPTRTPDIEWLIEATGIDTSRPFLRNGQWESAP